MPNIWRKSCGDVYKRQDGYRIEEMISELADFYGLSKQAVKMRIREMGYSKVDGALTYVNGQYVTPVSYTHLIYDLYAAISHQLADRIIELSKRYEDTLPELIKKASTYEDKVKCHLERMGFTW